MLLRIERAEPGRLRLSGEIDISTAEDLDRAIAAEVEQAQGDLVLDVDGLRFIDSTGIQLLVQTAQRLGEDRRLVLDRAGEPILRVLELVGFHLISNVQIISSTVDS